MNVEIKWRESPTHSQPQAGSVQVEADGLDGILEAFRAALVGMGYTCSFAAKLDFRDDE
jgi:hypothetical protein